MNEDQFSSLVLMRTKSSIEDLFAATAKALKADLMLPMDSSSWSSL